MTVRVVCALAAVLGAALAAFGVWGWSHPAGELTGGLELVAGAYVGAYLARPR